MGDNTFDIVLLTKGLQACSSICAPPFARSDHSSQMVDVAYMYNPKRASTYLCGFTKNYNKTNFDLVQQLLAQVDWSVIFENAADVDDYVMRFNKIFKETVDNYTLVCKIFKKHKQRYPKHLKKLIHLKRREWEKEHQIKNYVLYKVCCKRVTHATNEFHHHSENQLFSSQGQQTVLYIC